MRSGPRKISAKTEHVYDLSLLRGILANLEQSWVNGSLPTCEHKDTYGLTHGVLAATPCPAEYTDVLQAEVAEESYREGYRAGHITDEDLFAVFADHPELDLERVILRTEKRRVKRRHILYVSMLHAVDAPRRGENASTSSGDGVPQGAELATVSMSLLTLWQSCRQILYSADTIGRGGLKEYCAKMSEIKMGQIHQDHYQLNLTEQLLAIFSFYSSMRSEESNSFRGFLTFFIERYASPTARRVPNTTLTQTFLNKLPKQAETALLVCLQALGLQRKDWEPYLRNLVMLCPREGVHWLLARDERKEPRLNDLDITDYLAVAAVLDCLWEGRASEVHNATPSENARASSNKRRVLLSGWGWEETRSADTLKIPLSQRPLIASDTVDESPAGCAGQTHMQAWHRIAGDYKGTLCRRLFRLCRYLNLTGAELLRAERQTVMGLLNVVEDYSPSLRAALWGEAYEYRRRMELLARLQSNMARTHTVASARARAQVIFCGVALNDRLRRQAEAVDAALETFGAPGYFGLSMYWQGQDAAEPTPLGTELRDPMHVIIEVPRESFGRRAAGRRSLMHWLRSVRQRIPGWACAPYGNCSAESTSFWPWLDDVAMFVRRMAARVIRFSSKPGELQIKADVPTLHLSTIQPQVGFTDAEQADCVTALLRTIGLVQDFAPVILLLGYGSTSLSGKAQKVVPCAVCNGYRSGPSARVLAAMANSSSIRTLLWNRGLSIPEDTWFIAAEQNRYTQAIRYFDLEDMPAAFKPRLKQLQATLRAATQQSVAGNARRSRRGQLLSNDYVRSATTKANVAVAVIAPRAYTRQLPVDGTMHLVSYEANKDSDGRLLVSLLRSLLAGSGMVTLKPAAGKAGVEASISQSAAGASSSCCWTSLCYRTGSTTRLQLLVAVQPSIFSKVYRELSQLRQLINNRWMHVHVLDPRDMTFYRFDPVRGLTAWSA